MADKQTKKGKNGTKKYGRNTVKCAAYAAAHGVYGKRRFSKSKEHRNRGPLGIYLATGEKHISPHLS